MYFNIEKEEFNNLIFGEEHSQNSFPFENGIEILFPFQDRLFNSPYPNNLDNSFSLNFENLSESKAEKVINLYKSNKKEATVNEKVYSNLNDKKERINTVNIKEKNKEMKKKEISENNNKNSKENKNLFKVYPKKEHNKYNRDNLIDKIIRNFLNNIYEACNYEILKMKKRDSYFSKYKLFAKITSILVFIKKLKIE